MKFDLHFFGITRKNPLLKNVKFDSQVLVQIEINLKNKKEIITENKV